MLRVHEERETAVAVRVGERAVLFALAALIAFQLASAQLRVGDQLSYWLINYRFGFIRRGLGGQLMLWLGGGELPLPLLQAASYATVVIPLVALGTLMWLLVRRFTQSSVLLALLLAASPWTVQALADAKRPDQFGLAFLVAAGSSVVVARTGRRIALMAAVGLVGGVLVLVHEASLLVWGVMALPLVASTPRKAVAQFADALLLFGPGVLAATSVLLLGRSGPGVVADLLSQPEVGRYSELPVTHPHYASIIVHMGDGLTDSVSFVLTMEPWRMAAMLLFGASLAGFHWFFLRAWAPEVKFAFAGWRGRTAWTLVMASVAIVFATGVDWPRWFASFGTGVLVVGGLLLLRAPGPRWDGRLDPWAAAAAVYLATRQSYVAYGWWIPSEYVRWWL